MHRWNSDLDLLHIFLWMALGQMSRELNDVYDPRRVFFNSRNNSKGEEAIERSRGNITAHRLFNVRELGLGNPEPYVDRVIYAFLEIGEAVAARWIQMPRGILLMPIAPENPASGAIYSMIGSFRSFSFCPSKALTTILPRRTSASSSRNTTCSSTLSNQPCCRPNFRSLVQPDPAICCKSRENLTEFLTRDKNMPTG